MKFHGWIHLAVICGTAALAVASPPAAPLPAPVPAGPAQPIAIAPDLRAVLQMLYERKETLKDFTAKIDYSVADKTGDVTGKRGTLNFLMDPVKGAMFSVDFEKNTRDGEETGAYHQEIIFDGVDLTTKDYGLDGKSRLYTRSNMLPPGAKPGDAVTLNGALPLPIGIPVDEVVRNFDATLGSSKDANLADLKLVPKTKSKFDYSSLEVTVDKKQQLPIKMITTSPGGDSVTTIKLEDIKINTGTAKMLDSSTPAKDGWKERG